MNIEVGNVLINIKTNEQTISYIKDQIRRHWSEVVFSQKKLNAITEIMAYATPAAYKSWEKLGEHVSNREKLITMNVMQDMILIMIPARHSATEKFVWNMKEEAEKRFPSYG